MRHIAHRSYRARFIAVLTMFAILVSITQIAYADQWSPIGTARYRNISIGAGVMDNYRARNVNGNPVVLWQRDSNPYTASQMWSGWVRDTDNAVVYYAYANNSYPSDYYVLTGHGASGTSSGAPVYVHNYLAQNNQRWYLTWYAPEYNQCHTTGTYCQAMRPVVSAGMCIDNPNSEWTFGRQLWVWGCNGTAAQLFEPLGPGV
ncbi:RICIN domain-containing protein [Streptosporangium sp. CA-135522]|uniref:RICIN domain-containing protein n=1 Tax=Streptosporangium sp. CA-135522 TaxID=3240072 RepID=UPI003D9344D3